MGTTWRQTATLGISLVLSACASTTSTPTAPQTVAPSTTGTTPSHAPTGSTSEPIASATNVTEAPAGLVIRAISCNDVCGPNPGTTVLADGRVIWRPEDSPGNALSERTLTPAGLQAIRDAIDATGLLDEDGSYRPTLRPGRDAPGHGIISHDFRAAGEGGLVSVDTVDPVTFEGDNHVLGDVWDIRPAVYVLSDLARKLANPEAWLPADAWADARRIHEAESYLIIVTVERTGDVPSGPDVDAVPWPFPTRVDAVGQPYAQQGQTDPNRRCLPITREVARALAAAELVVGNERPIAAPHSDFSYAWARGQGSVNVALRQLMPDQAPTCQDGGGW